MMDYMVLIGPTLLLIIILGIVIRILENLEWRIENYDFREDLIRLPRRLWALFAGMVCGVAIAGLTATALHDAAFFTIPMIVTTLVLPLDALLFITLCTIMFGQLLKISIIALTGLVPRPLLQVCCGVAAGSALWMLVVRWSDFAHVKDSFHPALFTPGDDLPLFMLAGATAGIVHWLNMGRPGIKSRGDKAKNDDMALMIRAGRLVGNEVNAWTGQGRAAKSQQNGRKSSAVNRPTGGRRLFNN